MGRKRLLIITFVIVLISLACSLPFTIQQRAEFIATAVEATVRAKPKNPAAPQLPLPPVQIAALPPTATQPPAADENSDPCYQALLIGESVPDGTTLNAGEAFTKSWVLRNTGSCGWTPNYRLVFTSGNHMDGPDYIRLNEYVSPGGQAEFEADLEAPDDAGTFTGYWKMRADNGVRFAQVWVKIKVDASAEDEPAPTRTPIPAPTFAISDVQYSVSQNSHAACPVDLTITVEVTATGSGTAEIEWDSLDMMVCSTNKEYLIFAGSGTQSVDTVCTGHSSGPFEIAFLVSAIPGGFYAYYGPDDYTVDCIP